METKHNRNKRDVLKAKTGMKIRQYLFVPKVEHWDPLGMFSHLRFGEGFYITTWVVSKENTRA